MTQNHFIVCERDGAWQHTNRGSISAPFKTREAAIESAIDEARNSGEPDAEVIVQDPEMQTSTVWRNGAAEQDPSANPPPQ